MKNLSTCLHIVLCSVLLTGFANSFAGDGAGISKKYQISRPEGQNVDTNVRMTEASGLALSHAGKSLWTVSDNKQSFVFKMTLRGKPKDSESFQIVNYPFNRPDLEGICLSDDGQYMYLVQERELAIIKIMVNPGAVQAVPSPFVAKLSSMNNFATKVQPYLRDSKDSGLEGITFHSGTKALYVLLEKAEKEGRKGPLLIEINNDLDTIIESRFLSGDNGFVGFNGDTKIDGSGIDFDRTSKNHFFIVSDEGRRLFLYDWENDTAAPEIDLHYSHAEGVAYDPARKKIYIITDGGNSEDSKLYIYDKK